MHLDPRHLSTVRSILASHLPPDVAVLAFGSRVHGRNLKAFSDLDLCVKGTAALPEPLLSRLRAALDESDLPIKVDLVDWHGLAPDFQRAIVADLVPIA